MKILFFNLNYARNKFNGILDFIRNDFDVLCFQEINGEIKSEIDSILVDYECGFISKELGEFGSFNLATYINKKFNNFSFEILEDNLSETTPAVFLEVEDGNSKYNILNFHGQPKPGTKLDTKEREEASKRIIDFMKEKSAEKIIGGDIFI